MLLVLEKANRISVSSAEKPVAKWVIFESQLSCIMSCQFDPFLDLTCGILMKIPSRCPTCLTFPPFLLPAIIIYTGKSSTTYDSGLLRY